MPATTKRGPRSYVSEFTVSVGPVNVLGKLVGVKATGSGDEAKFVSVCPDCPAPTKPAQRYICATGHDHPMGELLKAKELDDNTLAFVPKESLEDARKSALPLNVMRCTVHPAAEVEAATFPSDSAYVLVPRNRDEYHDLLVKLVEDSGKAFVAQINLRNHEGFYRLSVWKGSLVVQRLYWPGEVNEFEAYTTNIERPVFNAAVGMIERVEEPFDADTYVSTSKERLVELIASLDPNAPAPAAAPAGQPRRAAETSTQDLLAALSAFGEAPTKAKKRKSA